MTLAVAAREAAVIDAYALIKRVVQEEGRGCFRITITHARTTEEARAVFDNMCRVAHEYLGVRLEYVGMSAPPAEAPAGRGCPARFGVIVWRPFCRLTPCLEPDNSDDV